MSTESRNPPLLLAASDFTDKNEAALILRGKHKKNRNGPAKSVKISIPKKLPIESVVCNKILLRCACFRLRQFLESVSQWLLQDVTH
ncbi:MULTISPECIES: hypothetical protein [Caballeronia]|uniref:hypothetical protein n=1 Tax=Caballeronia TaxID=1827195 RepID=UPI00117778DD|nr:MULTISPECIES: hypothetical protein [Caballeronia]MCE4544436.1 hypothetical protein [Caballeronia sp. PC1]MCE4571588.1 hypothetical protein [Caballeronia sp. CLC5]